MADPNAISRGHQPADEKYRIIIVITIGLIGLVLDALIRSLERFDEVRWGYVKRQ